MPTLHPTAHQPRRPRAYQPWPGQHLRGGGFTLIELTIVILILGILAAIIIPQFTSAAASARENALKMNMFRVREQLGIYKQEHNSFPSLLQFTEQMTGSTTMFGDVVPLNSPGALGPYLRDIPRNPFNDLRTVTDGAVGTSGWYYNEDTGDFRANDSAESREY